QPLLREYALHLGQRLRLASTGYVSVWRLGSFLILSSWKPSERIQQLESRAAEEIFGNRVPTRPTPLMGLFLGLNSRRNRRLAAIQPLGADFVDRLLFGVGTPEEAAVEDVAGVADCLVIQRIAADFHDHEVVLGERNLIEVR